MECGSADMVFFPHNCSLAYARELQELFGGCLENDGEIFVLLECCLTKSLIVYA